MDSQASPNTNTPKQIRRSPLRQWFLAAIGRIRAKRLLFTDEGTKVLEYMPQLDSLRWFAVLGVFISHSVATKSWFTNVPWGWLGVRLFFVLSGFLITGILLTCREEIDRGRLSPWRAARNFYIRRFLRLFPIYYAYLAVAYVMLPQTRPHILWFLTYTQNILFAFDPDIHEVANGHFWSLAVEEQFYLTWPWIVLFIPRRWLVTATVCMVAIGPLFRLTGMLVGYQFVQVRMWTPANFDTLGMGALLAVLMACGPEGRARARRFMNLGLYLGMPLFLLYVAVSARWITIAPQYDAQKLFIMRFIGDTLCGLAFMWLVGRASSGFSGWAGAMLSVRAFVYLGKISYGLYIFHYSLPGLLREKILPVLGWTGIDDVHKWRYAPILAVIWIVTAALSWHLYEAPLNGLKRKFPYRPRSHC